MKSEVGMPVGKQGAVVAVGIKGGAGIDKSLYQWRLVVALEALYGAFHGRVAQQHAGGGGVICGGEQGGRDGDTKRRHA